MPLLLYSNVLCKVLLIFTDFFSSLNVEIKLIQSKIPEQKEMTKDENM